MFHYFPAFVTVLHFDSFHVHNISMYHCNKYSLFCGKAYQDPRGMLNCVLVENSILSNLFQDMNICQSGSREVSNTTTTLIVKEQTPGCTFNFTAASSARAGVSPPSNTVSLSVCGHLDIFALLKLLKLSAFNFLELIVLYVFLRRGA